MSATDSTRPKSSPIGALERRRELPTGRGCASSRSPPRTRRSRSRPGIFFPAWTYNGRVPGPTLRVTEGDRVRIRFVNAGSHPHTMHFHGIHSARMDGVPGAGECYPGERIRLRVRRLPFGCHLYHCHSLAAEAAHPQGAVRRLHHRPRSRPPPRGGATAQPRRLLGAPENAALAGVRDGDERLRHQFRRRERGLRGQHRRTCLHEAAHRHRPHAAGARSI